MAVLVGVPAGAAQAEAAPDPTAQLELATERTTALGEALERSAAQAAPRHRVVRRDRSAHPGADPPQPPSAGDGVQDVVVEVLALVG